jgi:hypothetical protein
MGIDILIERDIDRLRAEVRFIASWAERPGKARYLPCGMGEVVNGLGK